jgi:hypothetical protein
MHLAFYLMQSTMDQEQAQKIALAFLAVLPVIVIVALAIVIVPFWFICKKAGFSPWLSLLNIVPFGGVILVYVLAFADWKVMPVPQPGWPPMPPMPPAPPSV